MSKIFLFLFLSLTQIVSAQNTLSENAQVSILTVGTANESHTLYGHTGLRVKDQKRAIDIVYNFGYFDFNTPYFLAKFVKGDLQYFVATNSYASFLENYRQENRSVYEQTLDLTLAQKQQLFDNLNQILFSNERFYTYKFIDRNCTTMVIDEVNKVLGGKIIDTKKPVNETYREILNPYLSKNFYQQLGVNIIFGNKTDQPAEKLFLPLELLEVLRTTKFNGKPLTTNTEILFEAQPVTSKSIWNNPITYAMAILSVIIFRKKYLTAFFFMLLGIFGVFLSSVGFYSLHEEVLANYNILLFNPIHILTAIFLLRKKQKPLKLTAIVTLICLAIYFTIVITRDQFWLLFPVMITAGYFLFRFAFAKNTQVIR
ncbi:DUF4105 domain-containing protein [Flavobacterium sp. NST-5]|uniref:DUF4105 domain-containing protein n=1 Tax=Flavobacterium ichthyis TaxID=2698827 RepID=A0ABW9Z849_9FLAO|nr:DUF4105 domain-containing protein [Flavobacterium ichthyis]NBL64854.1 DUF4105 domain-containing protein [Flavobacterium ichthyis]